MSRAMLQDWSDEMTAAVGGDRAVPGLASWLLGKFESRWSDQRIHSALAAEFELSDDVAQRVQSRARDGVVAAISGNPQNRPDPAADPVAHGTFEIVWNSFDQDSFFSRRRTPSRKWLDWYHEEKTRTGTMTGSRNIRAQR